MLCASGCVHSHSRVTCTQLPPRTEGMLPDTNLTGFTQCQAGLNSLSQPRDERPFNALAAPGLFNSVPSSVICLEAFLTKLLPLKTAGFLTADCSTCCLLEIPSKRALQCQTCQSQSIPFSRFSLEVADEEQNRHVVRTASPSKGR